MSKKYLYLIIIVLTLGFLGIISLPKINVGQCNSNYEEKKFYIRFPFVSIPLKFNTCK